MMSHVEFKKWPCRTVEFRGWLTILITSGDLYGLFIVKNTHMHLEPLYIVPLT